MAPTRRSHPAPPLYPPVTAPHLQADQLGGAVNIDWGQIVNKPASFPPSPHTHDGADIDSGLIDPSHLGTGVRDGTKFLRDDGVWSPGGGGGGATAFTSLTDVDWTGADPGEVPVWDGTKLTPGVPAPSARSDTVLTTASLAAFAEETGSFVLWKAGLLLKVAADRECRVRLYRTAAYRTADALRDIGVDPTGEHGVICDLNIVTGNLTLDLSPIAQFANGDGPATTSIYYAIQNRSAGTSTVQVTFTTLRLE